MNPLLEKFRNVAERTAEEQRLEELKKFAAPILNVLQTVKEHAVGRLGEGVSLHIVAALAGGDIQDQLRITAGLHKDSGRVYGDCINPTRMEMIVKLNGEMRFHPYGHKPEHASGIIFDVIPEIAKWVEKNMPETAEAIAPKPVKRKYDPSEFGTL